MLAVTTRFFTPAASAASKIRVVPDTAVYNSVFLKSERGRLPGTETTNIENDLRASRMGERRGDVDNGIHPWDISNPQWDERLTSHTNLSRLVRGLRWPGLR